MSTVVVVAVVVAAAAAAPRNQSVFQKSNFLMQRSELSEFLCFSGRRAAQKFYASPMPGRRDSKTYASP